MLSLITLKKLICHLNGLKDLKSIKKLMLLFHGHIIKFVLIIYQAKKLVN